MCCRWVVLDALCWCTEKAYHQKWSCWILLTNVLWKCLPNHFVSNPTPQSKDQTGESLLLTVTLASSTYSHLLYVVEDSKHFFKLSKYQTLSSSYNWNKSKRSSSSLQLTVKLLVSEWIDLDSGDISVFPYIFVFELKAHY